jgi:hypothetical protein
MNPPMRLLIMLTVLGVSGSLLFAAEPAQPPAGEASKAEEASKAGKTAKDDTPDKPEAAKRPQAASEPAAASEQEKENEKEKEGKTAVPEEDQDPEPKRAASAADKAGSPQRFTPSEQVRADFDVSFPIDI